MSGLWAVKNVDDDFEKHQVHSFDHSSNRYFIKFLLCACPREPARNQVPVLEKLEASPQAGVCRSLCGESGWAPRAKDGRFRLFISTTRTESSHEECRDDRLSPASPCLRPLPVKWSHQVQLLPQEPMCIISEIEYNPHTHTARWVLSLSPFAR